MNTYRKEFWLLEEISAAWSKEDKKISKEEIDYEFWKSYWLNEFLDKKTGVQLLKVYYIDKKIPQLLDLTSREDVLGWLYAAGAINSQYLKDTDGEETFKKMSQMKLSFSSLKMNESHEVFVNQGIFKPLGIKRDDLINWCKRKEIEPPKFLINPNVKNKKSGRPEMYKIIKAHVFYSLDDLYSKDKNFLNNKTIKKLQGEVKEVLEKKSQFTNVRLPKTTTFSQWIDEWCRKNNVERKKGQGRKKILE